MKCFIAVSLVVAIFVCMEAQFLLTNKCIDCIGDPKNRCCNCLTPCTSEMGSKDCLDCVNETCYQCYVYCNVSGK